MSNKRENKDMNITPTELIEFGKTLMIWGAIMFGIGATFLVAGLVWKDFFYEVAMGIMKNWK